MDTLKTIQTQLLEVVAVALDRLARLEMQAAPVEMVVLECHQVSQAQVLVEPVVGAAEKALPLLLEELLLTEEETAPEAAHQVLLDFLELLTQEAEVQVVVDSQPQEVAAQAALALSSLKCLTT